MDNISPATIPDKDEAKIIMRFTKSVLKKWWLFMIIGLIAGIIGVLYAGIQRPQYQSRLTFALDEGGTESSSSIAAGIAAQFGLNMGGGKSVFTGDNILEIMMSRRIIERALLSSDTFDGKRYTMLEYYIEKIARPSGRNIPSDIHYLPDENKNAFPYNKDSVLYVFYQEFSTAYISAWRPNKKLNIFEVNVTSANENFTKKFTDKLIEITNNFYIEISSKKSKETLEILEKRVPEMKAQLNSSIRNRASAEDANINPAFAEAQVPVLREQANSQVYGAAYAEMFKNLEMARFQYLKSIPLMQIIDKADYPMKKIKMGRLKTGFIFSVIFVLISIGIFFLVSLRSRK